MNWVGRALIGPSLWAVAFAALYALHGTGCAWGWPGVTTPLGNLHQVVLVAGFVVALVAAACVLVLLPRGEGPKAQVVAIGDWTGLAATLLTLFPVLGLSTCY